eukprot:GHVR01126097.1.p1 GENE.GHVR01126097.1~~GHVR01126097.1.p1  ORF type:complete len:127 (+),score=43.89 GHVR01126097.1:1-381(+)
MVLLEDNSRFISEYVRLLDRTRSKGSVWLWSKRHYKSQFNKKKGTQQQSKEEPTQVDVVDEEPVCLVRATDGKRKISTIVSVADMPKFSSALPQVMHSNMDGLKRRVKEKKLSVTQTHTHTHTKKQ